MGYLICIFIGGLCGAILTNLEKLERKGIYVTFQVKELHTQKKQ